MSDPQTTAGNRHAAWLGSMIWRIPGMNDSLRQEAQRLGNEQIAAIEAEAHAPSDPAAPLDVERLARAYDNLVLRGHKGDLTQPLGAYVLELAAQLAREYAALATPAPPKRNPPPGVDPVLWHLDQVRRPPNSKRRHD